MSEDASDEADEIASGRNNMTDEDAESLIGLSMSHVATRLKSPSTPAVEKRNALEDGDRYIGKALESPLLEELPAEGGQRVTTTPPPMPEERANFFPGQPAVRMSMPPGGIPRVSKPSDPPQSSLHGVFSGLDRKRSLSGGADALRKLLPKNLPSITNVGNLFASSTTFQRTLTIPKESGHTRSHSALTTAVEPSLSARPTEAPNAAVLRHSTSDDNLLYHTLSRASSLGDDSRFANQHEQVNSRVKAIRDSLYDRANFKLPQMPSMPNILPSTGIKKRASTVPNPTALPGITSLAASRQEVLPESARLISESPHSHPLDRVLESLTGDVVIMGGYRGSVLRSTKTNRQVWVPVKVGLNIRKVDLEVGLEPEDEERMHESIYASGMLQNIGPVDISRRLIKRLSECENARNGKLRVWDYGYDWRLSPHLLSKRLRAFIASLPSNQPGAGLNRGALVIAHSLGGLITRHVVNQEPELFSGVVYAGVPQSCVNILGPLRNGDAVLLSSRVLTAQV
ncbi:hypothetical protein OIDMADRAFT_189731, partial [Oidiodendron maius Zn]